MVFAFRMFELVAAIQICAQNWKTFPMITKKKNTEQNTQRTLSVDIESTMNPFFPFPKTLSRKLDFCLLTLMKFNVLEFYADIENRIFYALVFAFRMFELVAAIQICAQNWKTFPMIFTRKHNKKKY